MYKINIVVFMSCTRKVPNNIYSHSIEKGDDGNVIHIFSRFTNGSLTTFHFNDEDEFEDGIRRFYDSACMLYETAHTYNLGLTYPGDYIHHITKVNRIKYFWMLYDYDTYLKSILSQNNVTY